MNILIITYNWPPRNAIGTHRPYSWAKYWSKLGADVTVLTAQKNAFDEPLDLLLPTLPNVTVVEVPHLGGGAATGARRLWLKGIFQVLKKAKDLMGSRAGLILDARDAWFRAARNVCVDLARDADVVVSSFGPRSCHLLGAEAKRHYSSLAWVADYRDLWSQNVFRSWTASARQKERRMEEECVRYLADLVTTVSDELAASLSEIVACPVVVVPNGFDVEQAELRLNLGAHNLRHRDEAFRIVYTGTIRLAWQDPTPLFLAIDQLRRSHEIGVGDLVVEFFGDRQQGLAELAKANGVSDFVRIHGHVPRSAALEHQRLAHALLLLESNAPKTEGVLTGKLFEYISSGAPVLSVGGTPGSAASRVLSETGAGISGGRNCEHLARVLLELIRGEATWFDPDIDLIGRYSRESQAKTMYELLLGLDQRANT